jgi:pyrrolysine biosynthesis protein PylC
MGVPVIFDPAAYAVSSSKVRSNRLFKELGLETPPEWPRCGFPVIAKPVSASGSQGVKLFHDHEALASFFGGSQPPNGWVVQKYIEGPSYSLEVIGRGGECIPLQVTDLTMDPGYDCKRVSAPSVLSSDLVTSFEELSVSVGNALELNGIMDVEVILNDGHLHVLEIDARLPSQTPIAVFWSTDLNFLCVMGDMWTGNLVEPPTMSMAPRGVILEHLQCRRGSLHVKGEHIMVGGSPLRIRQDFFGADEALTDFEPGKKEWVATVIVCGDDRKSAWDRREGVIARVMDECNLSEFIDIGSKTGTND